MINKTRLIDEFIELVSVPCPSKDEKQEAELIMAKLRELGLEPEMDKAHEKTGGTCGNVWAYVKGNVPNAPKLLFEAHMDSVAPTTGTKVVRKDGVLYSDGTTTLGGDDKVGVAAMLEAVRALKEDGVAHGDVQLCFTVSEEIGCLGVVNMDQSWIKADYGYCMDIGGAPGEITYAAPKLYDIYVTVKGKALLRKKASMQLCWQQTLCPSCLLTVVWTAKLPLTSACSTQALAPTSSARRLNSSLICAL